MSNERVKKGETLEQDRDDLLEACEAVVNYFLNPGLPALGDGDVQDLVEVAIKRAKARP